MNMLPCVKRPIPRTGTDFLPFRASNGLFHARERCNRMAERVGNLNFARYQNSEPQLSPPCPYNRGYSCCLSLPSSHWSYLFTSPATFPALIVPNHLLESLPPSSATFSPFIIARHLRPSLFGDVSGRFRRPPPPASLFGDVSERFRCPSPPAIPLRQFLGEITVISISFAILRGFFIRVDPLICN